MLYKCFVFPEKAVFAYFTSELIMSFANGHVESVSYVLFEKNKSL